MDSHFEVFVTAATAIGTTVFFMIWGIKNRRFRPDNHLLPAFTVINKLGTSDYSCVVCLNDVCGGEKCRKLPKCGHVFHVDCVDAWLRRQWTCPLCRTQVTDFSPAPQKGDLENSSILCHLLSRADDFITAKFYDPVTQTLTKFLFKGVILGHP